MSEEAPEPKCINKVAKSIHDIELRKKKAKHSHGSNEAILVPCCNDSRTSLDQGRNRETIIVSHAKRLHNVTNGYTYGKANVVANILSRASVDTAMEDDMLSTRGAGDTCIALLQDPELKKIMEAYENDYPTAIHWAERANSGHS